MRLLIASAFWLALPGVISGCGDLKENTTAKARTESAVRKNDGDTLAEVRHAPVAGSMKLCVTHGGRIFIDGASYSQESVVKVHDDFGYDLIVGPNGDRLQLVISTAYRNAPPIGNIPYKYFQKLKKHRMVKVAIPIVQGDHTVEGRFPVVATTNAYFSMPYAPGKKFKIRWPADRPNAMRKPFDAIIGSEVAKRNDWEIGSKIKLVHAGVADHVHREVFIVAGVMQETHTPNDNTVFVPLQSYYQIADHDIPFGRVVTRLESFFGVKYTGEQIQALRNDPNARKHVTSILIVTRRPPNDPTAEVSPLTFMLQAEINAGYRAIAVNPQAEVAAIPQRIRFLATFLHRRMTQTKQKQLHRKTAVDQRR